MRAYHWSINIKLGLFVFAVLIAVASLAYADRMVDRLRDREQSIVQLWADAQAHIAEAQVTAGNPYQDELRELEAYLRSAAAEQEAGLTEEQVERFREAVTWAQGMPPSSELNFITNEILIPDPFGIPAIITDATFEEPLFWRNVQVQDTLTSLSGEDSLRAVERLRSIRQDMNQVFTPIPIELGENNGETLRQYVHYDESDLIKELRIFPYVQLLFVGLFILIGYVGFSYIRRNEQSSLWVGMAREAAHQLGTPISSLMGWTQLLRSGGLSDAQQTEALDEIDSDIERLQRVANRFSDIGSLPKLKTQPLAPLIERTVDYIRRRMPQQGQHVTLDVAVPSDLRAPVNAELFEWVIENLLKNALDAIEEKEGRISVRARQEKGKACIDVEDTGRGIDRRQWKNIFRPGYSTKKRGWGLGLSLAKRIVEDYHGGTLELKQSKQGEGSTFRIELDTQ